MYHKYVVLIKDVKKMLYENGHLIITHTLYEGNHGVDSVVKFGASSY